jgi:hypothetical protein
MVMALMIAASALLLFSTTNLDMMIAGNARRSTQAKLSATSGMSHFVALNLNYDTLRQRAGELQSLQIIPLTELGSMTSYEVKVHFCCGLSERQYVVESVGYYKKRGDILSQYPIRALYQGSE